MHALSRAAGACRQHEHGSVQPAPAGIRRKADGEVGEEGVEHGDHHVNGDAQQDGGQREGGDRVEQAGALLVEHADVAQLHGRTPHSTQGCQAAAACMQQALPGPTLHACDMDVCDAQNLCTPGQEPQVQAGVACRDALSPPLTGRFSMEQVTMGIVTCTAHYQEACEGSAHRDGQLGPAGGIHEVGGVEQVAQEVAPVLERVRMVARAQEDRRRRKRHDHQLRTARRICT